MTLRGLRGLLGFYLTALTLTLGPLVSNLLTGSQVPREGAQRTQGSSHRVMQVTVSGNRVAYAQNSTSDKLKLGFNAMQKFMDTIKKQYYLGIVSASLLCCETESQVSSSST